MKDSATCLTPPPPKTKDEWTPTEDELDQILAYQSLIEFMKMFWDLVETEPFQNNWHLESMAEHYEAVSAGDLHRLLVNIPPKHSKSTMANVFWPAWVWLRDPGHQFFHLSYADDLVTRDAEKFKVIIESERYRKLVSMFQPGFEITKDATKRIKNSFNGYRHCSTVRGMSTGAGGNTIVVDDPHDVQKALSDTDRRFVTEIWWDLTMSTRLHNAEGNFVVIMQRLHEADLSGHILKKDRGRGKWVHLCLPARYEVDERTSTTLDFEDPRKREGELIWPERFDEETQSDIEAELASWGTAGQMQQRPVPRGGGLIKTGKLVFCSEDPKDIRENGDTLFQPTLIVESIRYWDKAYTEGGGCRTAGVLIHKMREDFPLDFVVADCSAGQWSIASREARIKQMAGIDRDYIRRISGDRNRDVKVGVEEEGGAGKETAASTVKNLAGFAVSCDKVSKSKELRAEPFATQVEVGNVGVLRGLWNADYVDELALFPNGMFKDQVDATSGAFNKLTVAKKVAGAWGTPRGRQYRSRRRY